MGQTPAFNPTSRKTSLGNSNQRPRRNSDSTSTTASSMLNGRTVSKPSARKKCYTKRRSKQTNLRPTTEKLSKDKSSLLQTASKIPDDKVRSRVASLSSDNQSVTTKSQTPRSNSKNDTRRYNSSATDSKTSITQPKSKSGSISQISLSTPDDHSSTHSTSNKETSKPESQADVSDIKIHNAKDVADNDNEKTTNKSIFSKIISLLHKKITKKDVFVIGVITAGIITLLLLVGGGFITAGAGLAIAFIAFIAVKIISYDSKKELADYRMDKIKANVEQIKRNQMAKDKELSSKYNLRPPIEYTFKTAEDDEKIEDPRTLGTLQKASLGAKLGFAPIFGVLILLLGIGISVATGGIAALAIGLAFLGFCLSKGIADYLDYREKKQKFLAAHEPDILPSDTAINPEDDSE